MEPESDPFGAKWPLPDLQEFSANKNLYGKTNIPEAVKQKLNKNPIYFNEKLYFHNGGILHRTDGPAIVGDGYRAYYVEGDLIEENGFSTCGVAPLLVHHSGIKNQHTENCDIKYYKSLSDDELVSIDGLHIKNIDDPSYETKIKAVASNPYAIRYIKRPDALMQVIAVTVEPKVFPYIYWPGEKAIDIVLKREPKMVCEYLNYELTDEQMEIVASVDMSLILNFKNSGDKWLSRMVKHVPRLYSAIESPSIPVQMAYVDVLSDCGVLNGWSKVTDFHPEVQKYIELMLIIEK